MKADSCLYPQLMNLALSAPIKPSFYTKGLGSREESSRGEKKKSFLSKSQELRLA